MLERTELPQVWEEDADAEDQSPVLVHSNLYQDQEEMH